MKRICLMLALAAVCLGDGTNVVPKSTSASDKRSYQAHALAVDSAFSRFKGTNYVTDIFQKGMNLGPKWTTDSKPPLSARQAIEFAKAYLSRRFNLPAKVADLRNAETWIVPLVSLHQSFDEDVWYYKVALKPYYNDSFNNPYITVFVTMGGQVSELRKTDFPMKDF